MATLICIETSADICSVALVKAGNVKHSIEHEQIRRHSEVLTSDLQQLLSEANCTWQHIDAIAISAGPGSYTGLRVGTATAKGLCTALNIPLIAVPSLAALAIKATKTISENKYPPADCLLAMLDARRMEVYANTYNGEILNMLSRNAKAVIIDENSFDELPNNTYYFGTGAEKCQKIWQHKPFTYLPNIYPEAKNMATLATTAFKQAIFEDVAYYEPYYLKKYEPSTSKKKLF